MAKMMGPRFKRCRSLGLNVCGHPKAMNRQEKGTSRADKKLSSYGIQLLEKQRLRAYYGVLEKQFVRYVNEAVQSKGATGEILVQLLECRLDNLVYRMGLAHSIRQARQMVVHGHILVDDKKVDRPSYRVAVGEVISLKEKSQSNEVFKENLINSQHISFPYLDKDITTFSATLIRKPERKEIPIEINDILIVEYYSR